MTRTLIIGGGAAGMAAAIAAAQQGHRVTVLERNEKTLKKLGVSGNGRGNLLNSGPPVYYGNEHFAKKVLTHMPYGRLAQFFEELGVPLRQEEEGRCYPAALQAAVAVDALRLRAQQLGVQICPRTRALGITSQKEGFLVDAEEGMPASPGAKKNQRPLELLPRKYQADRVVITAGGAAAPAHGTDGTAYGLFTAFGHRLTPIRPALCALLTEKKPLQGLAGQRVRAVLRLESEAGETLHQTEGEALFAEDGVSGIAAMQLARFVQPGCSLHLDLRPELNRTEMTQEQLTAYLRAMAKKRADQPLREWLTGMVMPQVARALQLAAGFMDFARPLASLSEKAIQSLAGTLLNFPLPVLGVRGFDSAQVTAGGIQAEDFDDATLESRLQPGLYAAGEILDVDGDCGGFNLMFAFASGLLAGRGSH